MNYFICGFMGAGKTTLLKKIESAEALFGYSYLDLDLEIAKKHQVSNQKLGELIISKGIDWFRDEEKSVLLNILNKKNIVLALGGGTLNIEIIDILATYNDLKGFWLNTSFEKCYERISKDCNRPLAQQSKDKLYALYCERENFYKKYEEIDAKSIFERLNLSF